MRQGGALRAAILKVQRRRALYRPPAVTRTISVFGLDFGLSVRSVLPEGPATKNVAL